MIKKCLILAPHQDDEINLAGPLFGRLRKNNVSIIVSFITNGDNNPATTSLRFQEALRVKELLAIDKVYFLGYGDRWEEKHIYNTNGDEVLCSSAGYKETYGCNLGDEFGIVDDAPFLFRHAHSRYTRNNLKRDIRTLIEKESADLIICVDYDNHPDHKMLSLLFDEIIGELMKCSSYRPIILKKFAYLGAYYGPDDFFKKNLLETLEYAKSEDKSIITTCFPYTWEERISFNVESEDIGIFFWKSIIFRAVSIYKSQSMLLAFPKVINADVCYWYRNTNNFALNAEIIVSSGNGKFINDFKLIDSQNVNINGVGVDSISDYVWRPIRGDIQKTVKFVFKKPVNVQYIIMYQDFSEIGHINTIGLRFSNQVHLAIDLDEGDTNKILLDTELMGIKWLEIKIGDTYKNWGIREIEIYSGQNYHFPWREVPFEKFDGKIIHRSIIIYFIKMLYMGLIIMKVYIPCFVKKLFNRLKRREKRANSI